MQRIRELFIIQIRENLGIFPLLIYREKVKMAPLKAMEAHWDVDARVLIYTTTILGRGRVYNLALGRLYPRGKPPV